MNTVTVYGRRLQATCRALNLPFKEVGEWVKTSHRYRAQWCVLGAELAEADAATLTAHLAEKEAKLAAQNALVHAAGKLREAAEAQANAEVEASFGPCPPFNPNGGNAESGRQAWREAFYVATERLLMLDPVYAAAKAKEQKKRDAAQRRVKRELAAIAASVNARWTLDPSVVASFAAHANEPGEGRVVRTRTACQEDYDTKVYMALVAWVRHNRTDYDAARQSAKDSAYSDYLSAKECGEDCKTRGELLEQARADMVGVRDKLHAQYTAQAVAWLSARAHTEKKMAA